MYWYVIRYILIHNLFSIGGGPGAMEAANLGGYLANKTDEGFFSTFLILEIQDMVLI